MDNGSVEPRTTLSEAAQLEAALGFVLSAIRERGELPRLPKRVWSEAVRIARLGATARGGWRPSTHLALYLEAAGLDPVTGRIVDYEKFYAHREAWAERKAKRRKKFRDDLK